MSYMIQLSGLPESVVVIVATIFGASAIFLWVENR